MNPLFNSRISRPFGEILPLHHELGTHHSKAAVASRCGKQHEKEFPSSRQPARPVVVPSSLPSVTTSRNGRRRNNEDKRTVRFRSTLSAIIVLSTHEYTPQETAACWYDDDESSDMTEDTIRIIRAVRRRERDGNHHKNITDADDNDNDDLCTRGLEAMLDARSLAQRQSTKRAAIDAVLNEQDRQHAEEPGRRLDDDALHRVSVRATRRSATQALSLAAEDANFVKRELLKDLHRRVTTSSVAQRSESPQGVNDKLVDILRRANEMHEESARRSSEGQAQPPITTKRRGMRVKQIL